MLGALLLACGAGAWGLALFGQAPVYPSVLISLMFSGLSWALVPWWMPEALAFNDTLQPAIEPAIEEQRTTFGSVPAIMPEVLAPAKGKMIEIRRAYEAYALACKRAGAQAVPPVEFVPLMQRLCGVLNIQTRRRGVYVYLLDVDAHI